MLRGIGRINLFFDTQDYERFLGTMSRCVKDTGVVIYAYCLMSNHVHLLMKAAPDDMALFCKKVGISYALYYQQRYEHVGHLFQNRYRSESIDSDAYFMTALRYILHNPEPAGLGDWKRYPWSSAAAYRKGRSNLLTDVSFAMELAGGWKELMEFLEQGDEVKLCEWDDMLRKPTDADIVEMIRRLSGIFRPSAVQQMEAEDRKLLLHSLKQKGASIRQIERLTGVNRNIVQRA